MLEACIHKTANCTIFTEFAICVKHYLLNVLSLYGHSKKGNEPYIESKKCK